MGNVDQIPQMNFNNQNANLDITSLASHTTNVNRNWNTEHHPIIENEGQKTNSSNSIPKITFSKVKEGSNQIQNDALNLMSNQDSKSEINHIPEQKVQNSQHHSQIRDQNASYKRQESSQDPSQESSQESSQGSISNSFYQEKQNLYQKENQYKSQKSSQDFEQMEETSSQNFSQEFEEEELGRPTTITLSQDFSQISKQATIQDEMNPHLDQHIEQISSSESHVELAHGEDIIALQTVTQLGHEHLIQIERMINMNQSKSQPKIPSPLTNVCNKPQQDTVLRNLSTNEPNETNETNKTLLGNLSANETKNDEANNSKIQKVNTTNIYGQESIEKHNVNFDANQIPTFSIILQLATKKLNNAHEKILLQNDALQHPLYVERVTNDDSNSYYATDGYFKIKSSFFQPSESSMISRIERIFTWEKKWVLLKDVDIDINDSTKNYELYIFEEYAVPDDKAPTWLAVTMEDLPDINTKIKFLPAGWIPHPSKQHVHEWIHDEDVEIDSDQEEQLRNIGFYEEIDKSIEINNAQDLSTFPIIPEGDSTQEIVLNDHHLPEFTQQASLPVPSISLSNNDPIFQRGREIVHNQKRKQTNNDVERPKKRLRENTPIISDSDADELDDLVANSNFELPSYTFKTNAPLHGNEITAEKLESENIHDEFNRQRTSEENLKQRLMNSLSTLQQKTDQFLVDMKQLFKNYDFDENVQLLIEK